MTVGRTSFVVRGAVDWLLREDAPTADTILKLVAGVERGDGIALSKLLTDVDVACCGFDAGPLGTEGSSR